MIVDTYNGAVNVLGEEVVAGTGIAKMIKRTVNYEHFDGSMSSDIDWTVIDRKGGAAVVVYNSDEDTLLFVEQVRPALLSPTMIGDQVVKRPNARILEILAGGFGKDTPEKCARREAMEEAGVQVGRLKKIAELYLSPGITNEIIHLYFASIRNRDIVGRGGGLIEECEDIKCHWLTVAQVKKMLFNMEISDVKSFAGIMWFLNNVKS